MRSLRSRALLLGVVLIGGCEAMPPALSSAFVAFGRELIGTAAVNYTPSYADSVNEMLLALAEIATGAPMTDEALGAQSSAYEKPVTDDHTFEAEPPRGYATAEDEQKPYPNYEESYDDQPYAYEEPRQATLETTGTADRPMTLDVAILARTVTASGETTLRPIDDGAVLSRSRDDMIKLHFRANCNCYLYIVDIDSTGWVTQILPEAGQPAVRLAADVAYLMPEGIEWWGLDPYPGVEQLYFVLSRTRRYDLEAALSTFPTVRPKGGDAVHATSSTPALVASRGLEKRRAEAPVLVPTLQGVPAKLSADAFRQQLGNADLVLTRYFQHQ